MTGDVLCANLTYVNGKRQPGRNTRATKPAEEGAPQTPRGVPTSVLEPWILLLLKQWSGHGYWLLQSLQQLGLGEIDHTTLYKELRNLEKRGLVASSWLTGEAGPARRAYNLTEAGERVLQAWVGTVSQYQKMWTSFFDLYSATLKGLVPRVPAAPGPATQGKPTAQKGRDNKEERHE